MAFTLEKRLEPVLFPDPETDAGLLVGVGDCVADTPSMPCAIVEAEPVPPAVVEAVGITRRAAVPFSGSVFVDFGVEVGPPGWAVSVGTSVPVRVGVGVQVGMPGTPDVVGVRLNGEQSGVLVGVAFGSSVSVGTGVLVDPTGELVGTTGELVGTIGVSVEMGGSVGMTGGSVGTFVL